MKNNVWLIIIFCLVSHVSNAQIIERKGIWDYPGKKGLWDYPVKPGMEKWKQFKSNEEMVQACQIPEEVLSSLSTEDLTDLCLRYPLLTDFFAFENTNTGLDKLFNDFNGIRELYKRSDMSSSLTKRYVEKIQSFSFLNEKNSDLEKGFFIITVSTLEVLMSRIVLQDGEGKESAKEILQNLVTGYQEKWKYSDYFNGIGFRTNFFARGYMIAKICEPML